MRYYDQLLDEQRGPFQIIVDKTWDDIDPRDCFEEEDAAEICAKIDDGTYDWFLLRTRVLFEGVELSCEYLGGCCYEDAGDVLTDGMAEDQIYQALKSARAELAAMKAKFAAVDLAEVDKLTV